MTEGCQAALREDCRHHCDRRQECRLDRSRKCFGWMPVDGCGSFSRLEDRLRATPAFARLLAADRRDS